MKTGIIWVLYQENGLHIDTTLKSVDWFREPDKNWNEKLFWKDLLSTEKKESSLMIVTTLKVPRFNFYLEWSTLLYKLYSITYKWCLSKVRFRANLKRCVITLARKWIPLVMDTDCIKLTSLALLTKRLRTMLMTLDSFTPTSRSAYFFTAISNDRLDWIVGTYLYGTNEMGFTNIQSRAKDWHILLVLPIPKMCQSLAHGRKLCYQAYYQIFKALKVPEHKLCVNPTSIDGF